MRGSHERIGRPRRPPKKEAPPERGASGVWDREVTAANAARFNLRHTRRGVCDGCHTIQKNLPGRGEGPDSARALRMSVGYSFSSDIALIGLLPEAASSSENSTLTASPSIRSLSFAPTVFSGSAV
jgi:hypothetical protein